MLNEWAAGLLAVTMLCFAPGFAHAGALGPPRDVAFTAAADGTEQRYVELLPEPFDAEREHHVLIALHGHGSDRWQYVKDWRDECRAARDAAAKHAMIFVSPDYRASTSWMGPKAEADLVQIIAELRKRHKVGKVFLVGGTKAQVPGEYRKRSAELCPEALTMPIAFTVGGKDTSVPPESVLRLAEALKKLNRKVLLIHRETGGHSTNYADTAAAIEFVIAKALHGE